MKRSCLLCGCLCLTGLTIAGRMICHGCEAALVSRGRHAAPMRALLALYEHRAGPPARPAGEPSAT